jgi:soluble lytic murein transglycosylase
MIGRTASILGLAGLLLFQPNGAYLTPTAHPPLPENPDELWLTPKGAAGRTGRAGALVVWARGVELYQDGKFADALGALTTPAVASTPLADYADYYGGLALIRLSRFAEARERLDPLVARGVSGYLAEGAALAAADAAEGAGDRARAIDLYERLARDKTLNPDVVWVRLGRAALAAGDRDKALAAFRRVRYEFPLSDSAVIADEELKKLDQDEATRETFDLDLGRAERLFGARRYAEARETFQSLKPLTSGDTREIADLRVAECDFYLRRYASAREGVRPYLESGARRAEAQFFYVASIRELGQHDEYARRARALVDGFPDTSWAEETLNNLGTHYILVNEDATGAEVFAELYRRFPSGARAERAAWKAGWWAYKTSSYAETIRLFESAAAAFPRSDYRPSWLYWAARAHEHLNASAQAVARYRLVTTDYLNTYYGRLAQKRLERVERVARAALSGAQAAQTAPPDPAHAADPSLTMPPTAEVIRLLLSLDLYEPALDELRYAERAWGTSPPLQATMAWAYSHAGELRRAIALMKRAYPQHMTEVGGAKLPDDLLRVIFPLEYWESICRYSTAHDLDPYLVAALIGQESTFDAAIRSSANAWGLMQLVPSTGRRLARSLGIRRFRTAMLTQPETNIRLGTLYFSRLVGQFGAVHLALASYNAGESRVVRWIAERPGLERDEFIDDIPFPETQNYVKRVLGTAEDYRALYGKGLGARR